MMIENKENLSLILKLPFGNDIIIGKLKFDMLEIDFEQRISSLYMESIGFKPKMIGDEYCYFSAEIRNYSKQIIVSERRSRGSGSSGNNSKDISGSEILNTDNLLDGFTFILSDYKNDIVNIKKYVVKKYDDKFDIENTEAISLTFKNKNLIILKNATEVSLESLKTFFDNVDYGSKDIFNKIRALIFDSFVDEKGFMDIYEKYECFVKKSPASDMYVSIYNIFSYYYYVGQLDFYFLAEYFIKNNIVDKLMNHNPIYTGKAIEKVSEIPTLSKIGMEIYTKYNFSEKEDVLFKMEADKRVGIGGVKIIYDYIKAIDNIDSVYDSVFRMNSVSTLFKNIYKIINIFEITPKNLMNRLVRSMFYENVSINGYIQVILDYVKMANLLKVKIDKKIPADVVRLHDLFKDQIIYLKNKEIEIMFAGVVKSNNKLVELLPESDDFTIISPSNPNDLIQEGLVLNHCVGSYIDRYASGYSKIFFVRRKSATDQSFVTLELNRENQFVQFSTFSNKKPNTDVSTFVENWIKNISK